MAAITINGNSIRIGTFATLKDARRAYESAMRAHFGKYAYPSCLREGADMK
jgi:hypothetical protein